MTAFLAFFTGGWLRWIALAVALTVAVGMLRMHWKQQGRDELSLENAQAVARIIIKQAAATERVVIKYKKVAGETKIVTDTIEKEVTKYAETNPGLCLDVDWRRLHNDAATNTLPKGTP